MYPDEIGTTMTPVSGHAAIVTHNVAGLHAHPDPSSELTSQLVCGMTVRVIDREGALSLVEGNDLYRGWIRTRFLATPRDTSDYPKTTIAPLFADILASPASDSRLLTKLTVATPVVLARHSSVRSYVPILMPDGTTAYTHKANLSSSYEKSSQCAGVDASVRNSAVGDDERAMLRKFVSRGVVEAAVRLIGTPYLWGGTTPFGIDCSGLTQLCYRICGIQLKRDSAMQFTDCRFGQALADMALQDAAFEPGDLLFFHSRANPRRKRIGHVGLALGDGSFVHAAGEGRGTILSECDSPEWIDIFARARRLLPDADLSIDAA